MRGGSHAIKRSGDIRGKGRWKQSAARTRPDGQVGEAWPCRVHRAERPKGRPELTQALLPNADTFVQVTVGPSAAPGFSVSCDKRGCRDLGFLRFFLAWRVSFGESFEECVLNKQH